MSETNMRQATARVLEENTEDGDDALSGTFYADGKTVTREAAPKREAKPSHYKVICISMYTEDLKRLDGMVESLKARGLTKANRSALIRYALGEVDLDRVPKGL